MKFLAKTSDSEIIKLKLSYNNVSDRKELREQLKKEQKGFCAYSEKYISLTDSHDIEHFNPSLKGKNDDNYFNWYVCIHWMNSHKPKKLDNRFLPILQPFDAYIGERIIYEDNYFVAKDFTDIEAKNLIAFLGMNKPELFEERQKHVERIKSLRNMSENDDLFIEILHKDKQYLSFITALENSLHISLSHLL